jgi:hypothetical protein
MRRLDAADVLHVAVEGKQILDGGWGGYRTGKGVESDKNGSGFDTARTFPTCYYLQGVSMGLGLTQVLEALVEFLGRVCEHDLVVVLVHHGLAGGTGWT